MNDAGDETSAVLDLGGPLSLRARTSKADSLDHILASLDVLIFLEIGILYYCDNLSILLALRAVSQVLYVQEKPPVLPQGSLAPAIAANLVCVITHLVHGRPEATARSARGWIHGGLLVDFVGELGPITRWRLLAYDLLIAVLQITMLMVGYEKRKASGKDIRDKSVTQDIVAEEAGVRKSQDGQADDDAVAAEAEEDADVDADADGIEMDRLLPSGSKKPSGSRGRHRTEDDDMIATIDMKQTLIGLTRRRRTTEGSTTDETDARAARMRALLGRLIADRLGSSTR